MRSGYCTRTRPPGVAALARARREDYEVRVGTSALFAPVVSEGFHPEASLDWLLGDDDDPARPAGAGIHDPAVVAHRSTRRPAARH
jgi:hypothetical protein